jgi:2,4-dienoyl-CoA reductase-like NADH-dependent reductase (Old Yellow Enzyme family)
MKSTEKMKLDTKKNSGITNLSGLNDPFQLNNGIELKNRLVKASMSEELADRITREPTDDYIALYEQWSKSGAAVLLTGNIMVDRRYTSEVRNVVLDEKSDAHIFRNLTKIAQQHGSQLWAQLNHPGRQMPMLNGWQPLAPSDVAMKKGLRLVYKKPKIMTEKDILEVVDKFSKSAKLAQDYGFSGVQIHAAHGYLINQFLSPASNKRQDQWGGSLENRARILIEIFKAIRKEVGMGFPIAVKLNSADYIKGGFNEDDSIKIVQMLEKEGIDLLEISGGTYENPVMVDAKASTIKREAYFMDYAEKVRNIVKTPIMLTGGFESHAGMLQAIEEGATDFIGLARHFALDPTVGHEILNNPTWQHKISKKTTGIAKIDHLMLINISWYEQQLKNIAQFNQADLNLSTWKSIYKTVTSMGLSAFIKLSRS